ncbi:hypothetical protein EJ02DRAFT_200999 [Clathrospora elynae]|uniref:Secreted protein n=1 Tax=Clathrospora elynae TaxID=706981 RepID=A0A6A5SPE7_9PLEO|nr:hypothetical protein EJ02DRAFT_200999 [Clathrospora elynae]
MRYASRWIIMPRWSCCLALASRDGDDNTVTGLDQHDNLTVTRLMKRQAARRKFAFLLTPARQATGISDVSACLSLCASQEPPLSCSSD